ncbi:MAG: TonB-dependent receptor domain-containing protein [Croceivirga sp.]
MYLDFTNALGGGYSVFGKEVELQGIQRLIDNDEITRDPDGNLLLRFPLEELGEPLNAESSIGYNLGFDYKKGTFRGNINFFRNDITDQIDTEILATKTSGANVFGYVNRSRVYTQGLEVDLKYSPLKNLNLSAGYQLLYAFDKDIEEQLEENGAFARNPETLETIRINTDDYFGLINRSRHTLNVKTFYEVPKWDANANLRVIYRSRFGLTDINGNGFLDNFDNSFVDGYALVNLSFGKRFFKNYQVQIGANNLFDFRGIMPEPFRPLDTAGNRTTVFVDPGIQLFGRLNIDF